MLVPCKGKPLIQERLIQVMIRFLSMILKMLRCFAVIVFMINLTVFPFLHNYPIVQCSECRSRYFYFLLLLLLLRLCIYHIALKL